MLNAHWTTDIQSQTYKDALQIRYEVFVNEQQVPKELEIDDLEEKAHHLVLYQENQPIGTARIYHLGNQLYKIQRVAVYKNFRGMGIGSALIKECEKQIALLGGQKITLGAQTHALAFYKQFNYTIEGDEFMDAGIPHLEMTKTIH